MKGLFKATLLAFGLMAFVAVSVPELALAKKMGGGEKGGGAGGANSVMCSDGKYAATAGACKKSAAININLRRSLTGNAGCNAMRDRLAAVLSSSRSSRPS